MSKKNLPWPYNVEPRNEEHKAALDAYIAMLARQKVQKMSKSATDDEKLALAQALLESVKARKPAPPVVEDPE